ncbi:class II poly(R)-hydroxyalkanoic acid synthase [Aestuariicella hydrocarbonica]|uniref:Class II poly(R)-hydroxyalkanoic acid synthase n=1 Tax=Pseudomaricurvus hydrocarbonicus TaxID=1470433 RepID=A0A9E5MNS9_9GAMM|nr:alpha/beta fold hydrolase [Aestuariicella hydrocarbonica]NHO67597.1 class II poly(R)-hydroxyalkanoic acid synthase [Aestuariicella hydrocarbonica]
MNHVSAVPGIGDNGTSVKPEIFSELDVVQKDAAETIPEKLAKKNHGSHSYTRQSVQPCGSYPNKGVLSANSPEVSPPFIQSPNSVADHEARSLDTLSSETNSSAAESAPALDPSSVESTSLLEDATESEQLAEEAFEAEDVEASAPTALESSLDRLRKSSLALNQFADGLRKQYDLDESQAAAYSRLKREPMADAVIEADVADTLTADAGTEQQPRLHAKVPEKYRKYKKYRESAQEGPFQGKSLFEATSRFFLQTVKQPDVFVHHYTNFAKELFNIVQSKSTMEPVRSDKRFRDAVWKDNFAYRSVMQAYLAWDKEVSGWVEDLDMEETDRRRARFIHEQMSAMLSPTNSPLNPVAVKRAYQTGGKSVVSGIKNLVGDVRTNHGMPSQVRPGSYELGKDLADTEGAVVHRTEVLELIQYKMNDDQVICERPVLIVPPQLNKFYIFDLTPKNSLVRYLKDQGVQPFIISWRNPSKHHSQWNLDRYVSELETALEVMCEITGNDQVNLASACAGGLTSMALLGYLEAAKKPLVHSHSLFVTALQADQSFELGLFASRQTVELSRKISAVNGFMDGKALSHIFSWLRPTDLVWNFWINNYLLGKEPPQLDVLYWDNDSTRLPAGLHSDFLDIFIKDAFVSANQLTVKGYPIDIKKISMDFYCVGGDEDYLMPWKKCFQVPELVDSKCTFVLSTSGHIQSILRPPGIANTHYYTNEQSTLSVEGPDQWMQTATKNSGSWWEHWQGWLQQQGRSGKQRFAPQRLGSDKHPVLSPAPGLYVNEKVA